MSITDEISNREISMAIWMVIAFIVLLLSHKFRKALANLLVATLKLNIICAFVATFAYVFFEIALLRKMHLWSIGELPHSVIWAVTVALVSLFRVASKPEDTNILSRLVFDNIKVTVILEFMVSVYSFNLWIELVLVPIMAIITTMWAFSKRDENLQGVRKLLEMILMAVGIAAVVHSIYNIVGRYQELWASKYLLELFLPGMLSLLFVPYLYALALYFNYERIFLKIRLFLTDEKLKSYVRKEILFRYGSNTGLADRFTTRMANKRPCSKEAIDNLFEELSEMRKMEKFPPLVNAKDGWSPYIASNYLSGDGLITGYYEQVENDAWYANSPYLELQGKTLRNTVAYYIDGTKAIAKKLEIILNIYDKDYAKSDTDNYLTLIQKLVKKSLNVRLPDNIAHAVLDSKNAYVDIDGVRLEVKKDEWPNNKLGGYSIEFSIRKRLEK